MGYTETDESTQDGQLVLLYKFVRGDMNWFYNSTANTISHDGQDWEPASISISVLRQSQEIAKNVITLRFAADHELMDQFKGRMPEQQMSVTVLRGHKDVGYIVAWKGAVSGAKPDIKYVDLECDPLYIALSADGLPEKFSKNCRYALYGRGCNVDKTLFAVEATVSLLDGLIMTVPEASAFSDGYFSGGEIALATGYSAMISHHAGTQCTLLRPFYALIDLLDGTTAVNSYSSEFGASDALIYPGCDLIMTTCQSRFDNLINYGGQPWRPSKNPFAGNPVA